MVDVRVWKRSIGVITESGCVAQDEAAAARFDKSLKISAVRGVMQNWCAGSGVQCDW
jgi:hypothetical protein